MRVTSKEKHELSFGFSRLFTGCKCAAALLLLFSITTGAYASDQKLESNADSTQELQQKSGKFITGLAQDSAGRLVVTAEEHGLTVLQKDRSTVVTYHADDLLDNSPLAVAVDSNYRIWLGNRIRGLSCFDGEEFQHYGILDGLGATRVNDLLITSGDMIWCATESGVAVFIDGNWRRFNYLDGLPYGEITALAVDNQNRVWAGAALGGLATFENGTWSRVNITKTNGMEKLVPISEWMINDIHASHNPSTDDVWIATVQGIFRQNQSGWHYYSPIKLLPGNCKENYVTCIAESADGTLYFGTRKSGLLIYNFSDESWTAIAKGEHGLVDTYVSAILPQKDGTLWVGTYGYGLCQVSPSFSASETDVYGRDFRTKVGSAPALDAKNDLSVLRLDSRFSESKRKTELRESRGRLVSFWSGFGVENPNSAALANPVLPSLPGGAGFRLLRLRYYRQHQSRPNLAQ